MVKEFVKAPREIKTDETQPVGKFRIVDNGATVICHPSDYKEVQAALVGAVFELHREKYGISKGG